MVYRGDNPHPSHRGFAEAVGADIVSLAELSLGLDSLRHSILEEVVNGLCLSDYDVYIAEGTRTLYGLLSHQIGNSSILVYLAADQSLYDLLDSDHQYETMVNQLISKYGMGIMSVLFNKYINGVIAVSEFTNGYTSQILEGKPSRIAHPYIQPNVFKRLGETNPNLSATTAITVGSYSNYKGQDLLVEAWETVRNEFPDAELKLVGSNYPNYFAKKPGVTVCGYVDDLGAEMESASLYVQPSRADSYPVSVLEALRAGLPPLVTSTTGNRSEAKHIDSDLVVNADPESLAAGVMKYFEKPESVRDQLSKTARRRGDTYDADTRKQEFSDEFADLLAEIV